MIRKRHSFYETRHPDESETSRTETFSRSDINIIRSNDFPSLIDSGCVMRHRAPVKVESSDEDYKSYEIEEFPAKDGSQNSSEDDAMTYDKKILTNSDLDKMEIRVYNNMSKELQTEESVVDPKECNLKIFKTTVQEILDNFYGNMNDFETCKKKYHDILSKNNENIVDEMEDLIKEMIQLIVSSSSCISSPTNSPTSKLLSEFSDVTNKIESSTFSRGTGDHNLEIAVEAYKNENYYTDSTFDKGSSKITDINDKKSYNVYMLSPCIEIKLDDRNLLSEIHLKNRLIQDIHKNASADNVKRVAAKKLQVKEYMRHKTECESTDNIIPVKISYAKKNIHSEDYPNHMDDNNKSFIYKICNYLCKKLRKTTFG